MFDHWAHLTPYKASLTQVFADGSSSPPVTLLFSKSWQTAPPFPTIALFLGQQSGELSYWFNINFSSRLSFSKRRKQSRSDFFNWRQMLLLWSYSPTSCLDTGGRRLDRLPPYSWYPWGFFSMKDIITTVVYSACSGWSPYEEWMYAEKMIHFEPGQKCLFFIYQL